MSKTKTPLDPPVMDDAVEKTAAPAPAETETAPAPAQIEVVPADDTVVVDNSDAVEDAGPTYGTPVARSETISGCTVVDYQ